MKSESCLGFFGGNALGQGGGAPRLENAACRLGIRRSPRAGQLG
jgi:hypothetical protein